MILSVKAQGFLAEDCEWNSLNLIDHATGQQ